VSIRLALLLSSLALLSIGGCPAAWSNSTDTATQESNNELLNRIQQEVDAENVAERSYTDLANILEKDPANYRAHLLLGNCYDLLGLPEQAYEQFQLALKYGPNEPKAIVAMIKEQTKSGRMRDASAMVDDASKRFPDNPEIKFWAGNFLYSQQRLKEAEQKYSEALSSKSKIFGLPTAMAVIRFRQKHYLEAVALANQDLAKNPNYVLANEVTGLSLMKLHLYDKAVKPMSVAFNANALKSIIAQEYAQALYWKGDYQLAMRPALVNLAVSSDLYSNDATSKSVLGNIMRHLNKKQVEAAIEDVSSKAGIDKSAAFHFALGDVLDRYGLKYLAINQYRKGLALEPGFGRAWYRLGVDLETYKHDYPEALKCLKKAAALLPEDESAQKHALRLEDRWPTYQADWAWQLKDWLKKRCRIS
jgi:tetratricopeptide (TPR) repeat protein